MKDIMTQEDTCPTRLMDFETKLRYHCYLAFLLGFDLLQPVLGDTTISCDDAFDYCTLLAEEFHNGGFDDKDVPVYECMQAFVTDKMPSIEDEMKKYKGF